MGSPRIGWSYLADGQASASLDVLIMFIGVVNLHLNFIFLPILCLVNRAYSWDLILGIQRPEYRMGCMVIHNNGIFR